MGGLAPGEHPSRSASAPTRSATTARSCATRGCSSPACAQPDGDTDSRALLQLPDARLRPRRRRRLAATAVRTGVIERSPVLRAQLPLLGRREAVTPTGSASSSCTGCTGPASCWSPPSGSPTSRWHSVAAGRAAHARPRRPRGAARRAAAWATTWVERAEIAEGRGAAPHLRGEERGQVRRGARGRGRPPAERRRGAPLRAAREPGVGRRPGAARRCRPSTPSSTALGAAHRIVTTRSIEHAARGGAPGGRRRARPSRRSAATGCCGRSPAPSRAPTSALGDHPRAAAATTSRACSASRPTRPRPRGSRSRARSA